MIVVRNPDACTGCLICELACSLHHLGHFSRRGSSIKIGKSIMEPSTRARIAISWDASSWEPACDYCRQEDAPYCMRFCPETVFAAEGGDT